MRTLRRILLVSALLLLGLVSAASAECAWVLWANESTGTFDAHEVLHTQERWEVISGFPTYKDCIASLATKSGTSTFTKNGFVNTYLRCLPDPVDPRGPKGK